MSSPKWPEPLGRDAEYVMVEAVAAVAERSFFAVVDRCDNEGFAKLERDSPRWMVASIDFTDSECAGTVSCTLSEDLALALFDAFTGREPLGPPPGEELLDLIGEFVNMVCGAWLTRRADAAGFTLSPPTVKWAADDTPPTFAEASVLLTVNDLPLAVEVRAAPRVSTGAGV